MGNAQVALRKTNHTEIPVVIPVLHSKNRLSFLSILVASLFFTFSGVSESASLSQETCFSTSWPSDKSTLPADPDLFRAVLPNGFRYVIKENREPEKRVAVYLVIAAGSLHENDNQRGVAHFLEHMMFNGSKHFPPGSLVDYFQSIGMDFGGDTNAHTSYDQTVYTIILPDSSKEQLDAGFKVMADYARGALLLDSEIDRERGVILAEKRARDSAEYRTQVASTQFAFHGTKLPQRLVIGDEQTLLGADSDLLRSYYNSWYRPDNMILVVVGDVQVTEIHPLIQKTFSGLTADGPVPACPDFGKLSRTSTHYFYHHEPELGQTNIAIESFWDIEPENDSLEYEKQEILRYMGAMIMGYRLRRIQETGTAPFAHAGLYYGDIAGRIGYSSISAQSESLHWRESLVSIERNLRKAVDFGFSPDEVMRAKKEILAQLDESVLTMKSEDSRHIGQKIIRHLIRNRVYQSPSQEKEIYAPFINSVTSEDVIREFRAMWKKGFNQISVTGDVELGQGWRDTIAKAYDESQNSTVVPEQAAAQIEFPYLDPLPGNEAPIRTFFPEVDMERYQFANGLILNIKKTAFEKNSFQAVVNFGNGELGEPEPGMSLFVEDIINGSGTGTLPQSALNNHIAGSSIDMVFRIGESVFSWVGKGLNKDFELFIQLLQARLLDPGFRQQVFTTARTNVELTYKKLERGIDGAVVLEVQPFLASYDHHFGLPPFSDISHFSFNDLEKWFATFARPGDLEISIVGDIDATSIVEITNAYLGGIEVSKPPDIKGGQVLFPRKRMLEVGIDTVVEKSLITVAWATEDFWDIHRTRRFHLLSSVLEDRLRKEIRERLGASYSPSVASFGSRVYPGYGYIVTQMTVKPGMEDEIIAEIVKIGTQLAVQGVNVEELTRARGPLVTSLKDTVKSNRYWLFSALSQSARYPQQLSWPATMIRDFSSIGADELSQLAKHYLVPEQVAYAKITPGAASKVESEITKVPREVTN